MPLADGRPGGMDSAIDGSFAPKKDLRKYGCFLSRFYKTVLTPKSIQDISLSGYFIQIYFLVYIYIYIHINIYTYLITMCIL